VSISRTQRLTSATEALRNDLEGLILAVQNGINSGELSGSVHTEMSRSLNTIEGSMRSYDAAKKSVPTQVQLRV